jgi:predicted aldo/keto reductase-like oxidoreductase
MVGAALKSRRKNLIVSTKSLARDKQGLLADLDTSLREMQTDYVDIWYLHAKAKPADVRDDMMEAQEIAKKAGKIRFSGISTHAGHRELIPWVAAKPHFDVLLTTYNFTMNQAEMDPLLETAAKAGLGIVAMKVMAGGQKPLPITPTTDQTKEVLRRDGAMLAALKWTLRNRNVHTTIPSMVDADQLQENVLAMGRAWSTADDKMLSTRLNEIGPLYCRYCGSCSGSCEKGLPVSDVLRYVMYADGYGEFALGRGEFQTLEPELAAVRCSDCSRCTVSCPNGVRVVERLTRAQQLFA